MMRRGNQLVIQKPLPKGASLQLAILRLFLAVLPIAFCAAIAPALLDPGKPFLSFWGLDKVSEHTTEYATSTVSRIHDAVPFSNLEKLVPEGLLTGQKQVKHNTPATRISGPASTAASVGPDTSSSEAESPILPCSQDSSYDMLLTQAELGYAKNMKHRVQRMNASLSPPYPMDWRQFRQRMLAPTYSCSHMRRLGDWNEGGAWVCLGYCQIRNMASAAASPTTAVARGNSGPSRRPLVVSVSARVNTSFEDEAFTVMGAQVHLLNPSALAGTAPHLNVDAAGLAGQKVVESAGSKPGKHWYTLPKLFKKVGTHFVDILRLDNEGMEVGVVLDLAAMANRSTPKFGQILMEVHSLSRPKLTMSMLMTLEGLGYRMFSAEPDAINSDHFHLGWVHESLVKPKAQRPVPSPHAICSQGKALPDSLAMADAAYWEQIQKRGKRMVETEGGVHPRMTRAKFLDTMLIAPYSCPYEERWGLWGEGGKWVCRGFCNARPAKLVKPGQTQQELLSRAPVVVSVGSRGDTSFEEHAHASSGAISDTFDPFVAKPIVKKIKAEIRFLRYHETALVGAAGLEAAKKQASVEWASLEQLMGIVGTDFVDIFKIDCEGCEMGVVEEMKTKYSRDTPPFGQIQMEIHHLTDTTSLTKLLITLEELGYRMFHSEHNAYCVECFELAFIHESLVGGQPRKEAKQIRDLAASADQKAVAGSDTSMAPEVVHKILGPQDQQQRAFFAKCGGKKGYDVALEQAEEGFRRNLHWRKARMQSTLHPPYRMQVGVFKARMLVPMYACPHKERVGPWGEGGKWICTGYCGLQQRQHLQPVMVSVGSRGDVSVESDVYSLLHSDIHVFESALPAPMRNVMRSTDILTFHNDQLVFGTPGSLVTVLQKVQDSRGGGLGQSLNGTFVDILKIECGRCFVGFVTEMQKYTDRQRPVIGQILVEIHNATNPSFVMRPMRVLEQLGYRLFSAEPDAYRPANFELAFIHDSLVVPATKKGDAPKAFPLALEGKALHRTLLDAEDGWYRAVMNRGEKIRHALAVPGTMSSLDFVAQMMVPTYSCPREERVGLWGEGGKWVCLGYVPREENKTPVVVSIGSRGESSFELAINRLLGSKPYTFDPFLGQGKTIFMKSLKYLTFYDVGLTGEGGLEATKASHPAIKWASVQGMLDMIGHQFVDIFKIDCEGCEIAVVKEMQARFKRDEPRFGQIQMEIHQVANVTEELELQRTLEFLGYRVFHAEHNAYCGGCYEIALIHESLVKPTKSIVSL